MPVIKTETNFIDALASMWDDAKPSEEKEIITTMVDFINDRHGFIHTAIAFEDKDELRKYAIKELGLVEPE